jgi:hypothetical protein
MVLLCMPCVDVGDGPARPRDVAGGLTKCKESVMKFSGVYKGSLNSSLVRVTVAVIVRHSHPVETLLHPQKTYG